MPFLGSDKYNHKSIHKAEHHRLLNKPQELPSGYIIHESVATDKAANDKQRAKCHTKVRTVNSLVGRKTRGNGLVGHNSSA